MLLTAPIGFLLSLHLNSIMVSSPPPPTRVVLLLMALFYPIAFPIAMLLDCILGKEHGTFFRRAGEAMARLAS